MSISAMSSADYLVRHVAAGDGRGLANAGTTGTALTGYYTEAGYPPGQWLGRGLTGLDGGRGIESGRQVQEVAMRRLVEGGADPVTGEVLSKRSSAPVATARWRTERRLQAWRATNPDAPADVVAAVIQTIKSEEMAKPARHSVPGFDLTFKPPKSVSVLWAVADAGIQQQLYEAHREAVADVLGQIEDTVLRTRTGAAGVATEPVRGAVAMAFDHWDSRNGDPLLHTHVVVANRVQTADGKWRTIDGRPLFRATVTMSELYNRLVADAVTRRLGVGWEQRRRPSPNAGTGRELVCVPPELVAEFSQRSAEIEPVVDRLVSQWQSANATAAQPPPKQLWRLRQQAVLTTRRRKDIGSLAEAAEQWRTRAEKVLGKNPAQWATESVRGNDRAVLLRADDIDVGALEGLGAHTVNEVSAKRSTWTRWNLAAEANRQIAAVGWQFATAADAVVVQDRIVAVAIASSRAISTGELAAVPEHFRDAAGRSRFAPEEIYTSAKLLDAERTLLSAADDTGGPAVELNRALTVAAQTLPGRAYALDPVDQAPAAVAVATSGRVVDVLVGPAGTGKSTTMAGVRQIWEAEYGPGTVIGLAPSAQAAEVLGHELGIETENTAQWLAQQDHRQPQRRQQLSAIRAQLAAGVPNQAVMARLDKRAQRLQAEIDRWTLNPGTLLIVDEAGMAGTFALEHLASQVSEAGAKLLLVGDPHQLAPVEAGGMFSLMVGARGAAAPTLTAIRRFQDPGGIRRAWEEEASLAVRLGDSRAIDVYDQHGRLSAGSDESMIEAAYSAWRADETEGKRSVLIAQTNAIVTALNSRARADLVAAGTVAATGVPIGEGLTAGVGDRIVTRQINRFLSDGTVETTGRTGRRRRGFVTNGQQWTVHAAHPDGSLTVQLQTDRPAAPVTLPAWYTRDHVQLAYAATAHRCQGITTDTAHVIADRTTSREAFYVALTRGAQANYAYLATGQDTEVAHATTDGREWTGPDVMAAVLRNTVADLSAHETIRAEQDRAGGLAQLCAEYATIAGHGHDLAAGNLISRTGGHNIDTMTTDPRWPLLVTAIRQAHRAGVTESQLATELQTWDRHDLDAARTLIAEATIIHARPQPTTHQLIGGILPDATPGIGDRQVLAALHERARLIEQRIANLTDSAMLTPPEWLTKHLSGRPVRPAMRQAISLVVAYRDRWQIAATDTTPLGPPPTGANGLDQRIDHRHASQAVAELRQPELANEQSTSRHHSRGL